jgi:F1F0 ATPase subunit 2
VTVAVDLLLGALWGLALGLAHFAALRWTVTRLPGARRPGLLMAGSLAARLALIAAGLLLLLLGVPGGSWARAVAWLAGFLAARTLAIRREVPS